MKRNSTELKVKYHGNKDKPVRKKNPNIADIDKQGYSNGSPHSSMPSLTINTSSGGIDMSNTGIPLWANGRILPPYSGIHQFDTTQVKEIPLAQRGRQIKVYTDLNEFNIAEQAAKDSSSRFNETFLNQKNQKVMDDRYAAWLATTGIPFTGYPSDKNKHYKNINDIPTDRVPMLSYGVSQIIPSSSTPLGAVLNVKELPKEKYLKKFQDQKIQPIGWTGREGHYYPIYKKPVIKPVYQPLPSSEPTSAPTLNTYQITSEPVQFAPMREFTFPSAEMQPAPNPYPVTGMNTGLPTHRFTAAGYPMVDTDRNSPTFGKTITVPEGYSDDAKEKKYRGKKQKKGGSLPMAQDGTEFYNMERAKQLYTSDETGHWPSIDYQTGEWLKSKEHPTAWMEYLYGYALNPQQALNYDVRTNPQGYFGENTLQYIPKKQKGGSSSWLDRYQTKGEVLAVNSSTGLPVKNLEGIDITANKPKGPIVYANQDLPTSHYDPVADAIYLSNLQMDPRVMTHEMYHRQQRNEGRLRVAEEDPYGEARKKPVMLEEQSNIDYPYYNRRVVDQNIFTDDFLYDNPSFQFVNPQAVYNYQVNPQMYQTTWTAEGEAAASESSEGRNWLDEQGIGPIYVGGISKNDKYKNLYKNQPALLISRKSGGSKLPSHLPEAYKAGGSWTNQYQTGGTTIRQIWEATTGKDWSQAKKEGLTDGSYEANKALEKRLRAGDFGKVKIPGAKPAAPAPVVSARPASVVAPASPLYMQALKQANSSFQPSSTRTNVPAVVALKRDIDTGKVAANKKAAEAARAKEIASGKGKEKMFGLFDIPVTYSGIERQNAETLGKKKFAAETVQGDVYQNLLEAGSMLVGTGALTKGNLAGKAATVPSEMAVKEVAKKVNPNKGKVIKTETDLPGGLKMIDYGGKRNRSNMVAKVYDPANPNNLDNYVELRFSPETNSYYMSASMSGDRRKAGLAFMNLEKFYGKNAPKGSVFGEPPTMATPGYTLSTRKPTASADSYYLNVRKIGNKEGYSPVIEDRMIFNSSGTNNPMGLEQIGAHSKIGEWPPLLRYTDESSAMADAAKANEFLKSQGITGQASVKMSGSKNNPTYIIEAPNIKNVKNFLRGGNMKKSWLDKYQGVKGKSQTGDGKTWTNPLTGQTIREGAESTVGPESIIAGGLAGARLIPSAINFMANLINQGSKSGVIDNPARRGIMEGAWGSFGADELAPAPPSPRRVVPGVPYVPKPTKKEGGEPDDEAIPYRKTTIPMVEAGEGVPEVTRPQETESFGEAFKNARASGLKTFTWRGKLYGTQYKTEVEPKQKAAPAPLPTKAQPAKRPDTRTDSAKLTPPAPFFPIQTRRSTYPSETPGARVQPAPRPQTAPAKKAPTSQPRVVQAPVAGARPSINVPALNYGYLTAPASSTAVGRTPVPNLELKSINQPAGRTSVSKTLPTKGAQKPAPAQLQTQQPQNIVADARDQQINFMGGLLSQLNQKDQRQLPQTGVIVDKRTGQAYVKSGSDIYDYPVLTGKNVEGNVTGGSQYDPDTYIPREFQTTPRGYYTLEDKRMIDGKEYSMEGKNYAGNATRWMVPIDAYGMPASNAVYGAMHGTYLPQYANRNPRYTQPADKRWVSMGCVNARECDIKRTFNDIAVGDTSLVLDSKYPEDAVLLEMIKNQQAPYRTPLARNVKQKKKGGDTKSWLKNYE